MKIKNILLSIMAALSIFTATTINVEASRTTTEGTENVLKSNESTLFYMYSTKYGHYFLDPNTDYESVIFVGMNDWKVDSNFKINTDTLHRGQKFIGYFVDDEKFELTGIKKADIKFYNESFTDELELNQTTLFYLYSNNTGHYFLDPKSEYENIIYVGKNDIILDNKYSLDAGELRHGEKFIGTFADDTLWELVNLQEAV